MVGAASFPVQSVPAFGISSLLYVVEHYLDGRTSFIFRAKMVAFLEALTEAAQTVRDRCLLSFGLKLKVRSGLSMTHIIKQITILYGCVGGVKTFSSLRCRCFSTYLLFLAHDISVENSFLISCYSIQKGFIREILHQRSVYS